MHKIEKVPGDNGITADFVNYDDVTNDERPVEIKQCLST